jgi:hypothetical protein
MLGEWLVIGEYPFPESGMIIVAGYMPPSNEPDSDFSFTTIAICESGGLMNRFGDYFEGKDYLTHWMPLPEPPIAKFKKSIL